MAAIQLRRILSQNSKLIKGYHLLALIHMKDHEWNKARRILRKAARIDKTNTTTLRFLKEVDERTGVTTKLDDQKKSLFRSSSLLDDVETDPDVTSPSASEKAIRRIGPVFALGAGLIIGAAAFWLLAVPSIRQSIYREANDQIVRYSESLASQNAELSRAQSEAESSGVTAEINAQAVETEKRKSESYEALLNAYSSLNSGDPDTAAVELQKVYVSTLTEDMLNVYNTVARRTGSSGLNDDGTAAEVQTTGDGTDESGLGYNSEDGSYDYDYSGNYDYNSYDYDSYDYNSYGYNDYGYNYYDYGYGY